MSFSSDMRKVAKDLCQKLGNKCTLTKVVASGYDPMTGKTGSTNTDISLYSAPISKAGILFSMTGDNTNLSGFNDERVIVPWFGQKIDATWLYNGHNITNVSSIESQNDIIVFTISIGEKV